MNAKRIAELDKLIAEHRLLNDQPSAILRALETEREALLAAPQAAPEKKETT